MRHAFRDVSVICQRHGKFLGMGGVYAEERTRAYMAMNAGFFAGGSDQGFLLIEAKRRARFLERCGALIDA